MTGLAFFLFRDMPRAGAAFAAAQGARLPFLPCVRGCRIDGACCRVKNEAKQHGAWAECCADGGAQMSPYNTIASFRDGLLVQIMHTSYPFGPEE